MKTTFEILEKKLANTTWTEAQDPDFINALQNIEKTLQTMGSQIYIFITYFEQYVEAMQNSPLFATADDQSNGSQSKPTQTPAEPANRAERRTRKTPLDIVKDKK